MASQQEQEQEQEQQEQDGQLAGPAGLTNTPPSERICTFFNQSRGCIKGERCNFKHVGREREPLSVIDQDKALGADNEEAAAAAKLVEEKKTEKRVCEFYLGDRGCVKSDRCDFRHPLSPDGRITKRLCSFFNQPRGCVKESKCEFLHLTPQEWKGVTTQGQQQNGANATPLLRMTPLSMGGVMPLGGMPGMMHPGGGVVPRYPPTAGVCTDEEGNRVCTFYLTTRGCIKSGGCDFKHPTAPNGSVTTRVCNFFSTRGCVKKATCEFLHLINPPEQEGFKAPNTERKVCDYVNTPRGCIKGDRCDFIHPGSETAATRPGGAAHAPPAAVSQSAAAAAYAAGYAAAAQAATAWDPYSMASVGMPTMQGHAGMGAMMHGAHPPQQVDYGHGFGGFYGGYSAAPQPPNLAAPPAAGAAQSGRICDYFNTDRGCRKGDRCEFVHAKKAPEEGSSGPIRAMGQLASRRYAPY